MLIVDYTKQLGYVQTKSGETYPFYACNGLMAICPPYTNEEGVKCRYLHSFFTDKRHMTNMLGLTACYNGEKSDCFKSMFDSEIDRIVFNAKSRTSDTVTMANTFLKAGYCVQFAEI